MSDGRTNKRLSQPIEKVLKGERVLQYISVVQDGTVVCRRRCSPSRAAEGKSVEELLAAPGTGGQQQ